jgi:PAP2 superfamily C-terminal
VREMPEHWWGHLVVDVKRQSTHGCGDLIFSSHTTFMLVGVLTYTEYGSILAFKVSPPRQPSFLGVFQLSCVAGVWRGEWRRFRERATCLIAWRVRHSRTCSRSTRLQPWRSRLALGKPYAWPPNNIRMWAFVRAKVDRTVSHCFQRFVLELSFVLTRAPAVPAFKHGACAATGHRCWNQSHRRLPCAVDPAGMTWA